MRITIIYSALGIILWFLFLKSGVHATISGVLLAFVIPAEKTLRYRQFHTQLSDLTGHFGQTFTSIMPTSSIVSRQTRMLLLEELYTVIHHVHSPLERLEHGLKPWTAYLILPIFALANAGVYLSADSLSYFLHPVFWGIFLGLFVGKQIGVFGAGWLAIRMGWATMPSGVTWPMFYSVSILSGIGFTMSLFIADLGLPREYHDVAKVGILTSTILAASIGFLLTKRSSASAPDLSETAPDPYQVLKKLKKNSAITNEAQ